MYDKHQMQYYPDDEPEAVIVAYDYLDEPIYSDSEDYYIFYDGDLIEYTDSPSDHYLIELGGALKGAKDLHEII